MSEFVNPERERFGHFRSIEREGAIHMLNLIKLNETARYEDGTLVSGTEAYAAYGRESGPIFKRVGGRIFWSGKFELTLIGPTDEQWDICFIAEYPSADAFVEMVKDPEYQLATRHRTAAVKTSRLVRMEPQQKKDVFG